MVSSRTRCFTEKILINGELLQTQMKKYRLMVLCLRKSDAQQVINKTRHSYQLVVYFARNAQN